MNGKIYMIINKINNKIYVGQTTNTIQKRFKQHLAMYNKDTLISKAIEKYGKQNFEIKLLKNNIESEEDLNKYEEYYILKNKSLMPNGYNMCPGGNQYRRKPKISKKLGENITNEYKNGASSRQIAKKHNISFTTVLKYLRDNNIPRRKNTKNTPFRKPNIEKDELYKLVSLGKTDEQIAQICGLTRSAITYARKRNNIKSRI